MKITSTIFLSIIASAVVTSCASKQDVAKQSKVEKSAMVSTIGVPYFKAIGTEPFWAVEISEKEVKFTEPGNTEGIIFPNDDLQMFVENKKMTFATKTHMIIIEATAGECSDEMSDKRYSHKVTATMIDEVTGKATENYGCGEFFAEDKLSKIWMLKTYRDEAFDQKDFNDEIPYLEFIGEKNMFTGFAGCNRINGKINANDQNKLTLTDIASTKMMCGPNNREQEFIESLAKVRSYKFDGDTLILLDSRYVAIASFTKR